MLELPNRESIAGFSVLGTNLFSTVVLFTSRESWYMLNNEDVWKAEIYCLEMWKCQQENMRRCYTDKGIDARILKKTFKKVFAFFESDV